ncbi:unnamed protein product [Tuber melanosporum]|uniref:(Perigord truffle) hypothetical protein n=1 Tax=Tuber melanosporum (strain Mel28) TaxID=656061 RepID=D5GAB1_TUBMM|nr:uncharacterized protein GSTUM_00005216001 [Tuber melanosporum]CAZ81465.1 unnamed protein product [Tuber melanosporum]
MDDNGSLTVSGTGIPNTNRHGMVDWILTAKTPKYLCRHKFIIIANDITVRIISFCSV